MGFWESTSNINAVANFIFYRAVFNSNGYINFFGNSDDFINILMSTYTHLIVKVNENRFKSAKLIKFFAEVLLN